MRLLFTLLLLPVLAGAQVYDSAGFVKVRPVFIRDTVRLPAPPPVVIRDTIRITRDTTIYRDTCISGGNPTDPLPSTDLFTFTVQQNSNWNNVSIPFAKGEVWSGQWIAPQPYAARDKYFRFSMHMFYNSDGSFNWTKFDREFQDALNKGQKFSFGIMTHYPDPANDHRLSYDGGYGAYPLFLHQKMQAEPVKDWRASNGAWVPNWNSEAYLSELLRLHLAITAHIYEKKWQNHVNYIDVRGYGAYGEWHGYTIADPITNSPAGTRATEATLKRIIDAHTQGFPDWPLVLLVSTFDADRLNNTKNPPGVAAYALRAKNKWGLLGWRRDNWGATDWYLREYTDLNTKVVDGMRLDTAIMNRWKYAPIVGEPCCHATYSDLLNQVNRYRPVSIGNGNFSSESTRNTNITRALQAAGHKLTITGGSFKDGVVTINWRNSGLTPIYEHFDTYFEFRSATGQVITRKSGSSVSLRQPGDWSTTDTITGLPAGTYEIHIFVRNEQRAYPLGIVGSKLGEVVIK